MAVFGATGGASKASDRCSFTKISENNKDWCNGRGKQGKDALACVPIVSHGCETKEHTQTLTLRKASGIVRFWRGWCGEYEIEINITTIFKTSYLL